MIQVASSSSARDVSAMSVLRETQELRSLAAAFESAQAQRLRTGEQIRLLLGNRESAAAREQRADGNRNRGTTDVEAQLARIRAGGAADRPTSRHSSRAFARVAPLGSLRGSLTRTGVSGTRSATSCGCSRSESRCIRRGHGSCGFAASVHRCRRDSSRGSRSTVRQRHRRSGPIVVSRPLPRTSIDARSVGTSSHCPMGGTCDRRIAFRAPGSRAAGRSRRSATARAASRSHAHRAARTRRTIVRRRSSVISSVRRSFGRATRTGGTTTSSGPVSTRRNPSGFRGVATSRRSE